ncbi:MAG: 2-C-methyl-D-erythritol 2,4-cyclodiphosphate synthase [Clostridia bacterium]|nr:2-C-methyl-D-erythritol 2,4-cyclodiphosphate synthase [Clostridia bacterium]
MKKRHFISVVILAAGSSERFGMDKTTLELGGATPLSICLHAFLKYDSVAIACSDSNIDYVQSQTGSYSKVILVKGGKTRAESVLNALKVLPKETDIVLIHDAARCLIDQNTIDRIIESVIEHGSGIPAIRCRDTLWDTVNNTNVDRSRFVMTQTPQAFRYRDILSAYQKYADTLPTDDCTAFTLMGMTPHFVEGNIMNQKLTYRSDTELFQRLIFSPRNLRIGHGEDTHRYAQERDLILCGVTIPYSMGLIGHSDADAPIHAVIDALLGASALGDIGYHFPDKDEKYRGASSVLLLRHTVDEILGKKWQILNIDITIIAQEPKLSPFIEIMRENLSNAINIPMECVSVKATTPEHTGPEGRLEALTARAVALLYKLDI